MQSFRKIVLLILLPVVLVPAALVFLKLDLSARSEDRQLERLFEEMGVIQIEQAAQPVEIQLKDQNGRLTRLSEFRGKIAFINFWTIWCPPCVTEMPSMEKLHQDRQNHGAARLGQPRFICPV